MTLVLFLERNSRSSVHLKETKSKILRVGLPPLKPQSLTSIFLEIEFLPDVVNDLDVDFVENLAASKNYQRDARNIRKVQEATKKLELNIIHPLREGKKLLVLDIDYSKI